MIHVALEAAQKQGGVAIFRPVQIDITINKLGSKGTGE